MPDDRGLRRPASRVLRSLLRHQVWDVAVVRRSFPEVMRRGLDGADVVPLGLATAGSFAADPFGIDDGRHLHILYEHFDQVRRIGSIRSVTLDGDLAIVDRGPVFSAGHHLAYPFVVETAEGVFCLCEQAQARRLVLMKAERLPDRWVEAAVLLEGVAVVDATPVRHQGRWWLFATLAGAGAHSDLHLWHAPRLQGPWTAGSANPVKRDPGSARPAGVPLVVDGDLLRPAQDCRGGYGAAIAVNRVTRLDPEGFAEQTVRRIEPPASTGYPDGLHTIAPLGAAHTVIDLKREGFAFGAFAGRLRSAALRLSGRR